MSVTCRQWPLPAARWLIPPDSRVAGADCARRPVRMAGSVMPESGGEGEDHYRWATHGQGDVLGTLVGSPVKSSRERMDQVQAKEDLRPELDKPAKRAIEHP